MTTQLRLRAEEVASVGEHIRVYNYGTGAGARPIQSATESSRRSEAAAVEAYFSEISSMGRHGKHQLSGSACHDRKEA
jgi:hypothetical protein